MLSVKINGTGHYAPELTVTNDDFAKFVDTSDEWITTRTGMKTRHIAAEEPTWYMGSKAGEQALKDGGHRPEDIDAVMVTTCTSDYVTPSVASLIQHSLSIPNAFAFDLNVACTGMAFAIDCARRYLAVGDVKKILIISAETLTQFVDYGDRSMCVLFGDGAGACVVEPGEGIYGTFQHNEISGTSFIFSKRKRRATPFCENPDSHRFDPFPSADRGYDNITMNGREVYKFATKAMPDAIEKACAKAGIAPTELDLILPHQANLRILQTAAKNMGIDMEKLYVNIHNYGNTSSATIAIGLDECIREGRLRRGDKICLVGFGAGLTCGATVFQY